MYNISAVAYYPTVTALGSPLFKIIIENFAGYGFQKSGDCFENKKLFSWCGALADFLCPEYYTARSLALALGPAVAQTAHRTILRCQRERGAEWLERQCEPV